MSQLLSDSNSATTFTSLCMAPMAALRYFIKTIVLNKTIKQQFVKTIWENCFIT